MVRSWIRVSIHMVLILFGMFMIMLQMMFGIIPFGHLFDEKSAALMQTGFAVTWLVIIAFGVALGQSKMLLDREFFQILGWSLIIILGIPLAYGAFVWNLDIAGDTNYTRGNVGWGLDTLGMQMHEWFYVVKIAFLCVPMGVIILGVIGLFRSDSWDGYLTACLEVFGAVIVIAAANYIFSMVGIELFDLRPEAMSSPQPVALIKAFLAFLYRQNYNHYYVLNIHL